MPAMHSHLSGPSSLAGRSRMGGACISSLYSSSSTARPSRRIITVDAMVADPSKKPSYMLRIRGWFRLMITHSMGPTGPAGSDQAMLWSAPRLTLPSQFAKRSQGSHSPSPRFCRCGFRQFRLPILFRGHPQLAGLRD